MLFSTWISHVFFYGNFMSRWMTWKSDEKYSESVKFMQNEFHLNFPPYNLTWVTNSHQFYGVLTLGILFLDTMTSFSNVDFQDAGLGKPVRRLSQRSINFSLTNNTTILQLLITKQNSNHYYHIHIHTSTSVC